MFHRIIADFRESARTALKLTSLAAAMIVTLFITLSFLCAAAFVYVFQQYGLIEACLTGAGAFFIVALVAAVSYAACESEPKAPAKEPPKSAIQSALADPMLMAAGIQVIRAIGIKKLVPIIAIGGIALGILASRSAAGDAETSPEQRG